ncbi:14384_t:CDS:2 [Dentiscutata erythropus]|uniref:14384_t:CDS:1 n=1 Tax=Dentiscutata erythropus TaxID=1348616 RepID=A0A9N9D6Z9_9GLOM|nr:14384_t:CDS:2 [Dentiscutata erythropus]
MYSTLRLYCFNKRSIDRNKTFTFTEPDNLEVGHFSRIIQDPAISKKQD